MDISQRCLKGGLVIREQMKPLRWHLYEYILSLGQASCTVRLKHFGLYTYMHQQVSDKVPVVGRSSMHCVTKSMCADFCLQCLFEQKHHHTMNRS
jgi:hypothetical protein